MKTDTIAAIATGMSNSGIGIVRISGDDALQVISRIYRNKKGEPKNLSQVKSHTIHYGYIYDGEERLDEVLVMIMKGPNSYTAEDTVEIDCHGGVFIVKKILETVIRNGARTAEPGEFTKRAFLNGRIDLAQAEAVADVIQSTNEYALKSSVSQLAGSVSRKIRELREKILYEIAFIESALDDPEHISLDGYPERLLAALEPMVKQVERLLASCDDGRVMSEGIKTVILGKPNAGKSSLINKLLGEDRLIVSDIAGTTRDAIDTPLKRNGREYILIDTAGLRRKSKIHEDLERYSIIRTVTAVERADVVVMVIDAAEGVAEQDAKIAGIAHERGKGVIIAVNKWDAVEKDDKTIYKMTEKIKQTLAYMPYAEFVFISAKTGQRLDKLFELIDMIIENQSMRIATGVLNEILAEAVAMQQPPSDKGRRLKIFYMTQISVKPPTFVVFVNDKKLMHYSYTRYIENQIRNAFGFRGTPLRFIIRERKEDK
mgnify:CR=1 FL=1